MISCSLNVTYTVIYHYSVKPGSAVALNDTVECLARDRGAAGSSLTGVTVLCP